MNHDHTHDQNQEHKHHHGGGIWSFIASALHLPGHEHGHASPAQDDAFYSNELGVRTVKQALLILGITTVLQVIIYAASGSVALLADTVHNLGDALNSVPLWIAFVLARRQANRRYTYGYARAEDVAGLLIVASIVFSAAYIFWESVQKFVNPEPLTNLGWVAAASLIGFVGNELVAALQIRVGRRIGSEAMVVDGLHARMDGLTSLAVLIAVAGAWLGYPIVDPIVGVVIGLVIVLIARDAVIAIWYRLMDAVDPEIVERAEATIQAHPEIKAIYRLQMRWLGHRLHAETVLALDADLTTTDSEAITDRISHKLYHAIPNLAEVTIAVVPWSADGQVFWRETAHHRSREIEQSPRR